MRNDWTSKQVPGWVGRRPTIHVTGDDQRGYTGMVRWKGKNVLDHSVQYAQYHTVYGECIRKRALFMKAVMEGRVK